MNMLDSENNMAGSEKDSEGSEYNSTMRENHSVSNAKNIHTTLYAVFLHEINYEESFLKVCFDIFPDSFTP